MGIYNRLRILILDRSGRVPIRDKDACRAVYGELMDEFGAHYAGFQSHGYSAPNPCHFYLLDDPTDEALATLLLLAEKKPGLPLKLLREYKGADNVEYTFDTILADVASVLRSGMLDEGLPPSDRIAQCWSGVKVLSLVARA